MTSPDECLRAYEAAANAHNREGMVALIADDAVYWFSDGTAYVGRRTIAAAIERNFSTIADETYKLSSLTWLLRTETCAVCTYAFTWSGLIAGAPAGGTGRGTSVLTQRVGRWVILHEHLSKGQT